jgi:hypothetical protein
LCHMLKTHGGESSYLHGPTCSSLMRELHAPRLHACSRGGSSSRCAREPVRVGAGPPPRSGWRCGSWVRPQPPACSHRRHSPASSAHRRRGRSSQIQCGSARGCRGRSRDTCPRRVRASTRCHRSAARPQHPADPLPCGAARSPQHRSLSALSISAPAPRVSSLHAGRPSRPSHLLAPVRPAASRLRHPTTVRPCGSPR